MPPSPTVRVAMDRRAEARDRSIDGVLQTTGQQRTVVSNHGIGCDRSPRRVAGALGIGFAGIDRMGPQVGKIGPFQCVDMGGFENHPRCATGLQCLGPTLYTKAPPIAGTQPGEVELGTRGGKIVPDRSAECQKAFRHHRAYQMHPVVVRTGVATTVPVESGERSGGAGGQVPAEYILGHAHNDGRRGGSVPEQPDSGVTIWG